MKKLLALVVALVLVMSLATVASAAEYPTKGISVICPWGAGGGTDACLRAFCLALEKQLGCNPLTIFGNGETMPTITTLVQVLFASLQQYNHGITLNDAYDIFDEYLADGNTMTDFLPVLIEVYKVSGLIKTEDTGLKN